MLRTMTTTTLAGLIAATFSLSAAAADQTQQNVQQQEQQEQRQHHTKRGEEQHGARHATAQRDRAHGESAKKISRVLEDQERYSRFQQIWEASGIESELDDQRNYTVFVPVNVAFERSPSPVQEMITRQEQTALRELVRNHIVEGEFTLAPDDNRGSNQRTLAGNEVNLDHRRGDVTVNNVNIIEADVESGRNITVHEIDSLLIDQSSYASN